MINEMNLLNLMNHYTIYNKAYEIENEINTINFYIKVIFTCKN